MHHFHTIPGVWNFGIFNEKRRHVSLWTKDSALETAVVNTIYEINSSWLHRILNRLRRRRGGYVWISDRRCSDAWHCLVLADTEARALPFII